MDVIVSTKDQLYSIHPTHPQHRCCYWHVLFNLTSLLPSNGGHLILKANTLFIYNNSFLFQAQSAAVDSQAGTELSKRISCLEQEVAQHKEDAGKAQSEVERLLEILRETENEKNDKEKKINELER